MVGISPTMASHKLNIIPTARRVSVDYTNLNEACPKDSFPLPHINQIVDVAVRHRILSFLDAFSGYHHIPMHPPNSEKMAFITSHELYYYNFMPFGLKNAETTYQRLVTKIFRPLLGNTMEAYIDDMLVKSKERFVMSILNTHFIPMI